MTYSIEKARNPNLENTQIQNLFITDFLPDAPDGDFVKIYIYAYMCCSQGTALTHTELADRLGLDLEKVLGAWKYFSDRRIVRLIPKTKEDDKYFDIEFVDIKGLLYGGINEENADPARGNLVDPEIPELFQKISQICGNAALDGGDAQRIIKWIEKYDATPEIIEFAWRTCYEERGEKGAGYVEKIVKDWAGKNLKTTSEVLEYRARTDARSAVHKKLMEALGLRYAVITPAEEKKFNLWIDEYGYTPARLLELAEKTAGMNNKMRYLEGIIKKEREAEGKPAEPADGFKKPKISSKERNEYYRQKRQKNEDAAAARLAEIYAAIPAVRKKDEEISLLNMEMVKTFTSGLKDNQSAVDRLNKDIEQAVNQRKRLLQQAGYDADYTDIKFECARCSDTGRLDNGTSCDCCKI